MTRRRRSKSRRRCENCGRGLTLAALDRGEWEPCYDQYRHVVPCKGLHMRAIRNAVNVQKQARRRLAA